MPVRSSSRIKEETIAKMVKKEDERGEKKNAAASNTELGLIYETIPEDNPEPEPSFDESQDLNFQPSSKKTNSAEVEEGYVAEGRQNGKKSSASLMLMI